MQKYPLVFHETSGRFDQFQGDGVAIKWLMTFFWLNFLNIQVTIYEGKRLPLKTTTVQNTMPT